MRSKCYKQLTLLIKLSVPKAHNSEYSECQIYHFLYKIKLVKVKANL